MKGGCYDFVTNQYGLNKLSRGSLKLDSYSSFLISDKNFKKNGISKFCHFHPFLMPPDCHVFNQSVCLEQSCRGSPKKHFYQIILESDMQNQRRFLNFGNLSPFWCRSNQSTRWNSNLWTILKEGHQWNIPVKFGSHWTCGLGGDDVWS